MKTSRIAAAKVGLVACGLVALVALSVACASMELPEPESEDAQLYVRYCSGAGCHDAIPPQGSSFGYWNQQYKRMIVLMQKSGWELPNPEEEERILDYLRRNARGAERATP